MSFVLVKWYLDLITEDGIALVFYAAGLRWGPVRLGYASMLRTGPGVRPLARWTMGRVRWPSHQGDAVHWHDERLRVRGDWLKAAPPIQCTLAQGIHWHCHMPRAWAAVRADNTDLEGFGYAECLRVTVPPSRLPFQTLRWGRHLSADHSLVWIAWMGAMPLTRVWLDGVTAPQAMVTDTGLAGLPEGGTLELRSSDEVRDRRIPFVGLHEHKWLSRSSIVAAGQVRDEGWTLHEIVSR